MKIITLLVVRLKSTRLPMKGLAMIEDQTLTEHIIDRLKLSKKGGEVVLCTSTNPQDDPLIEIAKQKGIKCFRGHEDDMIDRFLKCVEEFKADVIVRTTGDNPFIDPFLIDKAVDKHLKENAEYTSIEGSPDLKAEVISVSALRKLNDIASNPEKSEYLTFYFKTPGFFKTAELVVDNILRRNYRLTIDEPGDLDLVREIFKNLYKRGQYMKSEDVIRFLDEHKELLELNKKVCHRKVYPMVVVVDGKRMIKIVDES